MQQGLLLVQKCSYNMPQRWRRDSFPGTWPLNPCRLKIQGAPPHIPTGRSWAVKVERLPPVSIDKCCNINTEIAQLELRSARNMWTWLCVAGSRRRTSSSNTKAQRYLETTATRSHIQEERNPKAHRHGSLRTRKQFAIRPRTSRTLRQTINKWSKKARGGGFNCSEG